MITELSDRTLWYDGVCEVDSRQVPDLLLLGTPVQQLIVRHPDSDIDQFNTLSDEIIQSDRQSPPILDYAWRLPAHIMSLDLTELCSERLEVYLAARPHLRADSYISRLRVELQEISNRNLDHTIRAVIYVLQTMRAAGKVWGVGRGSSCASLVLFLLELHSVDPVLYSISHTEFFHD